MSVTISFYAVDTQPLEQFLDESLGKALQFVAANGREEDVVVFHTNAGRYVASPRFGILGRGYVQMTPAEVTSDPNLSIHCREHLAQGSAAELRFLLGALAGCSTMPWVTELSVGYRRWWIGTLLDWVERAHVLSADEYAQYEELFFQILRGYGCAKLPAVKWSRLSSSGFPIIPAHEDVLRMGVWTAEDVELFVLSTETLLSLEPEFGAPRGFRERSPAEPDSEWNDWVHSMLEQLLKIETLGYDTPNIVSFIG